MVKALITGINGQDGSYLAEFLLNKGYEVYGIVRPTHLENPEESLPRINHILKHINLYPGNFGSYLQISKIIRNIRPDELYHLAAQSYVSYDFDMEFSTFSTNLNSIHYILGSLKEFNPNCKLYFAGSSEMFGECRQFPQNENTPFNPRSIYGISKLAGYHLVKNYRTHYGINASTGILYNHESPRRGLQYVTRKITYNVAKIATGQKKKLTLGNIDAKRDWGHAKDYVRAIWLILKKGINEDFVISTGNLHTVREFLDISFSYFNLDYRDYIEIGEKFFRPSESVPLVGDSTKARKKLGWKPKISFKEMIYDMLEQDLELVK